MSSKTIDYNPNEIKKIAYDYLSDEEKGTVVTSVDDYIANGEVALNIEEVWLYASCDEVKLKTIGFGILWVGNDMKEHYNTFGNRNKIVLKVSMDTSDFLIGSVILFVDPVMKEVIGYGARF
jgi:hypothetical protein